GSSSSTGDGSRSCRGARSHDPHPPQADALCGGTPDDRRRGGGARRRDGPARRRADGDGRLPDLPRRRAAAHPVADGRDRRRARLRADAARGALSRPAGEPRRRPAGARPGPGARLRADRAARAGRARGVPRRRPAGTHGRRRGRPPGALPARPRPAARRPRRRRGGRRRRGARAPRRGARPGLRPAGGRDRRPTGRRSGSRQAQAGADLTSDLVELVRGAPELVAYGRGQDRFDRIRERDRLLVRLTRRASLADGLGNGLCLAVTGVTVAGVVAVAAAAHDAGRLDRVSIGMLGLLALASFEAVQPLPNAARELVTTLAAGRRLLDLTDAEPAVADPADPAPAPRGPVTVALEGVAARYRPGERPVLVDAGLVLEPGRRVALVGPSGAGKTTVANLLVRFLDPEHGRVTLAGRDLRDYRQEDVRAVIAVAGQDAHLFSASILENVRLSRPNAGDGEIETALRLAGALEWVRTLPEGWHTPVGEEGRELSGGQRQRIGVARALLSGAPVLVLDEPTAHLDRPMAEALVRDVLAAAGDRTVLLITHRAEGLEAMDEI